MTNSLNALNTETLNAWNANAEVWDKRMGDDGNGKNAYFDFPVFHDVW